MNRTVKWLAATATGVALFGGGMLIGHGSTEEIMKEQYEKAIHVKNAEIKELSHNYHPAANLVHNVTITFAVKEIKDETVKMEAFGGGEVIHYPVSIFWESIGEPEEGDFIAISWELGDYLDKQFNQISNIAKVEELK